MVFNHPEFLYGLFALLIPIIIHLFNFRRYRKLLFSNIEFLKHITVETRKQNELKQLLVLMTRLLALTALILAFADPQWSSDGVTQKDTNGPSVIYIDNSFSMMADGEEGRLFDQAVSIARNIVRAYPDDARFALLTNDIRSSDRLLTREATIAEIDLLAISATERKISSVLRAAANVRENNRGSLSATYLISDFQENGFDINLFPADTAGEYFFIPMRHAFRKNVFVDSCWIGQPIILPGKTFDLNIRVSNASDTPLEKIPLKLSLNSKQKAAAGVDLAAHDSKVLTITVVPEKAGWQYGLVSLEDYPVTFDDNYHFAFEVQSKIPVLTINGVETGSSLQQFYYSDSTFMLTTTDYRNVNYNTLSRYSLIVLNSLPGYSSGLISQLGIYMENGGNVLFIPAVDGNRTEENNFLRSVSAGRIAEADTAETRVVRVRESHPLFRDIITGIPEHADLPVVRWHVRYSYPVSSGLESLATLLNGDDFLLAGKVEKGNLFLLSVSLDQEAGNFRVHPLFVPVMYGTALQGNPAENHAYVVGRDIALEARQSRGVGDDIPYRMVRQPDGYTFIPEQLMMGGKFLLNTHDGILSSGFYDLRRKDSLYHVFAYNYNRAESYQEYLDPDAVDEALQKTGIRRFTVVESALQTSGEVEGMVQKESAVWKLFIIIALLMLLVEVLILRFWK